MVAYVKPAEDLWKELGEQRAALRASCVGYDAGNVWEAKRLAAVAHILFHDGRQTTSLLKRLGLRDQASFTASGAPIRPGSMLTEAPLVFLRATSAGALFMPHLEDGPSPHRKMPFAEWWDEPVLRDKVGRLLSRRDLVRSLRDQDGGAHVDGSLQNAGYASL